MRYCAIGTIFSSILCYFKISSTILSKCIQRTITKQTVKLFLFYPFVAWKKFTLFVAKKRIFFTCHFYSPSLSVTDSISLDSSITYSSALQMFVIKLCRFAYTDSSPCRFLFPGKFCHISSANFHCNKKTA